VSQPTVPVLELDLHVSSGATLNRWGTLEDGSRTVSAHAQIDWLRPQAARTFEDIALDGVLAIQSLELRHPAWFKAGIPYPEEDFSSPDLPDLEVDVSG
jgi:hypothetical protein